MLEPTFKSGDKVGRPDIEEKDMQYLYKQGDEYHFMDNKTFEQTFISAKVLGESKNFLKANINASILFFNGKAIGVTLPNSVDLKVVKCDPGVRGDTVSGAQKPALLETGYEITVPLFINEGDVLKIDTRDGKYLTRVATACQDESEPMAEKKKKSKAKPGSVGRGTQGGHARCRGAAADRRDPRGL